MRLVEEWQALVRDGRVAVVGPVRQEILSGIRSEQDFDRLRDRLADFPDIPILTADYEQAARFYNACRARGVAGGGVDLLICAVANRLGLKIFTTDPDFATYARYVPLKLLLRSP